jgi:hypothetical protein
MKKLLQNNKIHTVTINNSLSYVSCGTANLLFISYILNVRYLVSFTKKSIKPYVPYMWIVTIPYSSAINVGTNLTLLHTKNKTAVYKYFKSLHAIKNATLKKA